MSTYLWTTGVNSSNAKTGKIPTAYPADLSQAWESCDGCPLRSTTRARNGKASFQVDPEHPVCYFWTGNARVAARNMQEAQERGKDYSLTYALANRLASARAVRMSGGGDPSSCDNAEYLQMEKTVREAGLAWLDYTHFWASKGAWLKGHALASCDSWDEARDAVSRGWRATVHIPESTLAEKQGVKYGLRYTLCPAQRKPGDITCNDCRLCDARKQACDVIVFLNH